MHNTLLSILLLLGVGLNGPALAAWPGAAKQKAANGHSTPLAPDACQIGLAGVVGQPASIKTTCGDLSLGLVCAAFDWCSETRRDRPRQSTDCQTLQSQHVLLRV